MFDDIQPVLPDGSPEQFDISGIHVASGSGPQFGEQFCPRIKPHVPGNKLAGMLEGCTISNCAASSRAQQRPSTAEHAVLNEPEPIRPSEQQITLAVRLHGSVNCGIIADRRKKPAHDEFAREVRGHWNAWITR